MTGTTKKSPAKARAAAAPPTISTSAIAETAVRLVSYRLLERAEENVRHTREAEDVAELAEDIAGHGLLQSLIGYELDPARHGEQTVYIVGGGRRLAALALLHTRGMIDESYKVPVVVRDQADAVELSLAENLARRDMSPVDEFMAFRHMLTAGSTVHDLAKRFGFSERYVKQRMRLAGLHSVVLEALGDRQIAIDSAMAYASSQDLSAQERVFKAQAKSGWKPHDPDAVRRDLSLKAHWTSGALFKFVGDIAYRAAGGEFEDDLFGAVSQNSEGKRLIHSSLIERLAKEKMSEELVGFVTRMNAAGAGINGGAVASPSIDISNWQWIKPKAPADFALVECQYDKEKRWNAARNCGAIVKGIVGLDREGTMVLADSAFFVSKDKLREVKPPLTDSPAFRHPTPEELEERQRAGNIEKWSRRLALGSFDDTRFAGRTFWPPDYEQSTARMTHADLGDGYAVNVRIFVTTGDAEAHVDAAIAKLDAIKAANAAAADEVARAKQHAQATAAENAAKIRAMDPPPAVVIVMDDAYYRWADGGYWLGREDDQAGFGGDGEESLEELLTGDTSAIGPAFETVEAYVAAAKAGEVKGTCRVCCCTEARGCDDGCSWHDHTHTLCDNTDCLAAAGVTEDAA